MSSSANTESAEKNKVLVVEDDWLIAEDLTSYLRDAGYDVMGPVPTVEKAISLIASAAPTVAILDLALSDGNSDQIAEALDRRAIPFAFLTGHTREQGRCFPERPYLQKPVDHAELLRTVATLLAQKPST